VAFRDEDVECQSACKTDPRSASKIDPLVIGRR
jgi:hypothetical protein